MLLVLVDDDSLYVSAISRACEGIVTILVTGIADFSSTINHNVHKIFYTNSSIRLPQAADAM